MYTVLTTLRTEISCPRKNAQDWDHNQELLEGARWSAGRKKSYVFKVPYHPYSGKSVLEDSKGIICMEMPCFETCFKLSDMTPWETVHRKVLLWYFSLTAPEVWRNLLAFGNCWPQRPENLVPARHDLGMGGVAYVLGVGCCRKHTLEHLRMLLRLVPTVSCPPEPGGA